MTELATQELARARAARIRAGIQTYLHTLADVAAAYAQRDWTALGYADWQAYVDGEYGAERLRLSPEHRAKAVAELRLSGMSQRAIGTALGVSVATVNRDLGTVPDETVPDRITGLDGREQPASRPQSPAPEPEPEASTSTGPGHDNPQSRAGEAHAGPDTDPVTPGVGVEAGAEFRGSASAGDSFADVLDRLVPDDNPHREWQGNFIKALGGVNRLMLFTPAAVAEKADQQCLEELARLAEHFADWRARIAQERAASTPDNVTPIRRIS